MSRGVSPAAATRPDSKENPTEPNREALEEGLPDAEGDFYPERPWCLNPYPTVVETVAHLGEELARLAHPQESWQVSEGMTNVYLLSSALLNSVEEYLRGRAFQLPKKAPAIPLSRLLRRGVETLQSLPRMLRRTQARRWRASWHASLDGMLALLVAEDVPDATALAAAADGVAGLLRMPLPRDLQAEHTYFPSAFRKHDLTHFDVLALGRRFARQFPDRDRPILVVGLRTAGAFFAPLVSAQLRADGYRTVEFMTVRPDKGPGPAERVELKRSAGEGRTALILDDSPRSGDTVVKGVALARAAGFPPAQIVALVPVHSATQDWRTGPECFSLADTTILTLPAEEWYKVRLLDSGRAESRIEEYFHLRGFSIVHPLHRVAADALPAELAAPEEARRARLKRVYEVRVRTPQGQEETRLVLAKSVGWGWLGYHAFLVGRRLARFVPPVLGLRDGILYSEWLPQSPVAGAETDDRQRWVAAVGAYVAARARNLGLRTNPLATLGLHQHHDSFRLLDRVLGRAYGGTLAANLMRPRIRRRLCAQPCPLPTLIDGKMDRAEWIAGPSGLLKTDYEHHGMGKNELNLVDPAYDLAEAVLSLALSAEEEEQLIECYVADSGDAQVAQRLFLNKLLAGVWATAAALKSLFRQPTLSHRQQEFHQRFLGAWHFLTVHAARFCGKHCQPPKDPRWGSPLVVLDVDGVLDRRVFGFPCTTAAGIEALALLHAHGIAVALDTARSVPEVQEYCRAYGLVGGVAEYGSYAWDAVNQRGSVLVSPESLRQLERAREALQQLPGAFLDDRHHYSIRAYTYEDRTRGDRSLLSVLLGSSMDSVYDGKYPVPLPTLAVRHLLADLGLDRLSVRQTTIDTTIVAREIDKGSGLLALQRLAGQPDGETIAIGDSESDLPMFRAAGRCFAPAHIGCARVARSLGCRIVRHSYQRGLLDSVRSILHPDGGRCPRCSPGGDPGLDDADLFLDLLRAADRNRFVGLLRALLEPGAYQFFLR